MAMGPPWPAAEPMAVMGATTDDDATMRSAPKPAAEVEAAATSAAAEVATAKVTATAVSAAAVSAAVRSRLCRSVDRGDRQSRHGNSRQAINSGDSGCGQAEPQKSTTLIPVHSKQPRLW